MATINLRPDQVVLIKELVRQQLERLQDLRIALDPSTFIRRVKSRPDLRPRRTEAKSSLRGPAAAMPVTWVRPLSLVQCTAALPRTPHPLVVM